MLLKISWQTPHAPDLTFLFHKHPDKVQSFDLPFGRAIVFYPALSHDHGEIALLVEIDAIGLSRRSGPETAPLYPYVNDRPYVASSFLSVAIARVFGSALNGKSRDKPELIEQTFDFEISLVPVVSNQGATLINSLFEPLGYEVRPEPHLLDEQFPAWGNSSYFSLTLRGRQTLSGMLGHLYVLIPALDDEKHYWVGEEEVEKLLRHGEHWLSNHPSRDLIVSRYLHRIKTLTQQALEQLIESPEPEAAAPEAKRDAGDVRLNQVRLEIVLSILKESGASRVLDLGCGEGRFLRLLLQTAGLQEIVGMDVSHRALELAAEKLQLASHSDAERKRIQLIHGSLLYRDRRLEGFDAAVLIEVIEHLDPQRSGRRADDWHLLCFPLLPNVDSSKLDCVGSAIIRPREMDSSQCEPAVFEIQERVVNCLECFHEPDFRDPDTYSSNSFPVGSFPLRRAGRSFKIAA